MGIFFAFPAYVSVQCDGSLGGAFLKEKLKTFFAVCVLIVTIPYIVTLLFQGIETSPNPEKVKNTAKGSLPSTVKTDGQELDVEEYLAGIVAEEIPLDGQPEAIKAQAVIARTELLRALESEAQKLPESMSREEMLRLWGQDGFEKNYQVLEEALQTTKGEILTWEGKPIWAAFHAVRAGKTRTAKEALAVDQPCLNSVDSTVDIPSPDYLKVIFIEKNELAAKLNQEYPDANLKEEGIVEQISVGKRDAGDYVLEVQIGESSISGEDFRNCLGLNSACFFLKEVEGEVRIVTKGLGHGLGLSQYGASEMAKEGADYKEILQYYYQNAEITKENDPT